MATEFYQDCPLPPDTASPLRVGGGGWTDRGIRVRQAEPLSSCVIVGRLPNFPQPQFSHL